MSKALCGYFFPVLSASHNISNIKADLMTQRHAKHAEKAFIFFNYYVFYGQYL